ncbi:hypothetical protein ACFLRB_04965 [Acidobacteriota bacterium]
MIKQNPVTPQMSDTEKKIRGIEKRIEKLKIDFNLFFSGELDIPPESEREAVEKLVRNMLYSGHKAARLNLLMQNVASRFTFYNNMWLKKLNELETGVITIKRKRTSSAEEPPKSWNTKIYGISLNNEDSFDNLYKKYVNLFPKASSQNPLNKENLIRSIKTKMISSNLVDAKAAISVAQGKLKIRIKK